MAKLALAILGPTAAGKTDLALELAANNALPLPVELISVDSAMVYRGMDIGTAKPSSAVLQQFPHRLIDICDPSDAYSVARFRRDALQAIDNAHAAGRLPLLVGGTMLYFKALSVGLADLPAADGPLRQRLQQEQQTFGLAAMHAKLQTLDPIAAAQIHPNDPQRLLRAMEVIELTGHRLSDCWQTPHEASPLQWIRLAVMPTDRQVLHQRIAERFQQMLRQGFIEEVAALRARGDLSPELPSMKAVGYRQVWQFLDGELSREALLERGIIATRQLAKRQITWLRSFKDLIWLASVKDGLLAQTLAVLRSHGAGVV